jgi:hypothetical protein
LNAAQNWIVQFGDYDLRAINAGYNNDVPSYGGGVTALYGASGGMEYYGARANPKPAATITITCVFRADTSIALQDKLDDFARAHDGTMRRLFYAPYGTTDRNAWRYTYAKPQLIEDNRPISSGVSHSRQVQYSIHDPYWHQSRFSDQSYLDDGVLFDAAETYGTATTQTLTAGGSFTVRNEGSAPALPFLVFNSNSGTLGGFVFQRIVDGRAAEITYAGTVNTSSNLQLLINCKNNYCSDLANLTVTAGQTAILQLLPGDNVLKLASASTLTGSPQLLLYFEFAWH